MQLARLDSQTVALTGIDSFFFALLQALVPGTLPGDHAAARARLYSSPTGGAEPEFDAEWREYVEPGLREHFDASRSIVERDLAALHDGEGDHPASLLIPVGHLDSWINALNQARLVLAERHGIAEMELEEEVLLGDARTFATFQIEFYGQLLYSFLREVEREV